MLRVLFLVSGGIIIVVIFLLFLLICKEDQNRGSSLSPLERGLATTRKIYSVFSVQLFIILILLLIFDLEVVFIIRFVLRGRLGRLKSMAFIVFIIITL